MNPLNIFRVASITIEESLRKKILYVILFLSLLLVAGSSFVNVFGLGAQVRIIKDFSLTGINIFSLVFTLALFFTSVPREIEQKTLYPLLARPLRRSEYLWGKFLGNIFLVFLNLAILSIELILILKNQTGFFQVNVFSCVFLYFVQCSVVGAFVLFFSILFSPPLTLSLSLFVFILGNFSTVYVNYLSGQPGNQFGGSLLKIIKEILPHFDYFDIKNSVVHDYIIDPRYFPAAVLYGAVYTWLLLVLAEMAFRNKDL